MFWRPDPLYHVPVLLFSGGEPLIRPDFFELAEYAEKKGVRPTLSTNGTLITREAAQRIKDIGVGYVGISLDGLQDVNDEFRGHEGAFQAAMVFPPLSVWPYFIIAGRGVKA